MGETRTLREAIIYNDLAGIVGYDHVSRDEVTKQAYVSDLSWLGRTWPRRGWPTVKPDFIVWPETTEQVSQILQLANVHKIPVIPYCGGAGVQGGTVPLYGGIILDVKRLNRVLKIDERNLTVTTQAGVIGQDLEWALNAKGYTYAHIPQSSYCSGIGGFLAARSAGVLSTKYGKIAHMVLGMEVVLPTGKIIRTKPVPETAAGPYLNHLFLGSEGTLGVITEATLAIHPMPEERRFRGIQFPSLHTAMEGARKILRRGLRPAAMRASDEMEGQVLYKQEGSLMILCFDGFKELVDLEEGEAIEISKAEGGVDLGPEPGERWWKHRYTIAYPTDKGGLAALGPDTLVVGGVIDTAGSFDYLEAVHEEMGKAVNRIRGSIFLAHFSHWYKTGGMMYPYVLNTSAKSEEEMVDLHFKLQRAAVGAILKLGGTINHHHGIGLTLGGFMKDEFGAGFGTLQDIKRTLDPNNIMNPGKLGFEGR